MKKIYLSFLVMFLSISAKAQWTGQWNQMPDMNESRSEHMMIALQDGRALAIGGWDGTSNLKSSEYNTVGINTWTASVNDMSSAHSTGAAVVLANGKVLVTGGYTGSENTKYCELYDPSTNMWTMVDSLNSARSYHTITLLQNGKVFVSGGFNGTTNLTSCEIYDPVADTWTTTLTGLTTGRSYHTATLLQDGKILIAGGFNPNSGFQLSSVEIYDPIANTWPAASALTNARAWHTASLLADGKVMVSGGEHFNGGSTYAYDGMTSCEIYNPATNSWTAAANLPVGACYNHQFSLSGNRVLMVAGASNTNYNPFTYSAGTTHVYDVAGDSWMAFPLSLDGRAEFAATKISDSIVMVSGGIGQSTSEYFRIDAPTSVSNLFADQAFTVYPSPSTGLVFVKSDIESPENKIVVRDILGKKVAVESQIMENQFVKIDLTNQPRGIYFIHTTNGNKVQMAKVIISD